MRAFFEHLIHPATTVHLDPARQGQTVEGWGTSLAWWGHIVGGWSDTARGRIADLVFSPTVGLGLNVVRYNIGGGDDPAHTHMRLGGDIPGFQPRPGAWDWTADANQRWMLEAARERGARLCEAFANSPPYWMTRSGCAAGSADGDNNLRDDQIDQFAAYLVEVVAHFRDAWGLTFRTIEAFNEPAGTNWKRLNRQEGCHVSPDQQKVIIARLAAQLTVRGLTGTTISAADDYSIDQTLAAPDRFAAPLVTQINTHSYSGTRRADLRALAATEGKRLWMSEYGTGVGAHDHGSMVPALALAAQIRRDMTDMQPAAWVYWQAVEHEYGHNHNWGCIHADFSGGSESFWLTKQYHAMGQYSRFIRPGYVILGADHTDTRVPVLAACDPTGDTLVVVFDNPTEQDIPVQVDLSRCGGASGPVAAYRTSATEDLARLEDIQPSGSGFSASMRAGSISTYVVARESGAG